MGAKLKQAIDCSHVCCEKITAGRTNPKKKERKPHTHVYSTDDCPTCYAVRNPR